MVPRLLLLFAFFIISCKVFQVIHIEIFKKNLCNDDFYTGGGHQYLGFGPKIVEPPGECRSNHDVICALARVVAGWRLGSAGGSSENAVLPPSE